MVPARSVVSSARRGRQKRAETAARNNWFSFDGEGGRALRQKVERRSVGGFEQRLSLAQLDRHVLGG